MNNMIIARLYDILTVLFVRTNAGKVPVIIIPRR